MSKFLNDKQKEEITSALEELGNEYGIPLKGFDNLLLTNEPMTIIYDHKVVGLCKSEVTTDYFEDGDKDSLKECMRQAVIKLKQQLQT